MKINFFVLLGLFGFLLTLQSCKNPCRGYVNKYYIDNSLHAYLFNPGTYWVYQDTATLQIDSQYISAITLLYDTTNIAGSFGAGPCGPVLYQVYIMNVGETIGSLRDTSNISIGTMGLDNEISVGDSGQDTAQVIYTVPNEAFPCFSYATSYVTLKVGANYFKMVVESRIGANCTRFFPNQTDIYLAPNFGIIKKVEYNSTGIEIHCWTLIRWKIM